MKRNYKLEYIWLDGSKPEQKLRSKTKVESIGHTPTLKDLSDWSFDGSSTNQATGDSSDCILKPVKIITDPMRPGGYLVMCEVYGADEKPHVTNYRALIDSDSTDNWYGFEQEYFIYGKNGLPLGVDSLEDLREQGDFYCGVGHKNVAGRNIADEHMELCLEAGLNITGVNMEVMKGQLEYQLFAKGNKTAGDDLWLSRYILYRLCELYEVEVNIHPKPITSDSGYDANGSGMHVNFSNTELRTGDLGKQYIINLMKCFEKNHMEHIENYGSDNDLRLSGDFETQHISKFSYGISDRGASIRIPIAVAKNDWKGYLEDRRPASNANPYKITKLIAQRLTEVYDKVS